MKPIKEWDRWGRAGVVLLLIGGVLMLFDATRPVSIALLAAGTVCMVAMGRSQTPPARRTP